jgi:nitroreductase
MDVLTALRSRRSVRAYLPDPVDESTVRRLLRAATLAPSAMNGQPWTFAVVQSRKQLARYSNQAKALLLAGTRKDPKFHRYSERFASPAFNVFYDAGTLIAIGANEPNDYTEADCWLAAACLMLAATDGGLGTCVIGFAIELLNSPELKRELGFAPGGRIIAPIIVGHPTGQPPVVERQDPRLASWST